MTTFADPSPPPPAPTPDIDAQRHREERAQWINFLGRPPPAPPDAPTEEEIRGWLQDRLSDGEELVALDCSLYPCYAEILGAGPALAERVGRDWPHATVSLGSMFAGEGDDFVSVGQGTVTFLVRPVGDARERRFVGYGSMAHSQRASSEAATRFRIRTEAADGRP